MKHVHVVSGVAIKNGEILMGLRKPDALRPDLWELPGGKIEPGESPQGALTREWMEELAAEIGVRALIDVCHFRLDVLLTVELYHVVIGDLDPEPLDHVALRWVKPLHAMRHLPCSPAFYYHYDLLTRWMAENP